MALWLLPLLLAPPALLDSDRALGFGGEVTPNGSVAAALAPAPDAPGLFSLKLTYRLERHAQGDWLDAMWRPARPLTLDRQVALRIRAEQPAGYLILKITDPDNPGANHSAYESPLTLDGQPLPAGQWVDLLINLPAEPERRDSIDMIGFYIGCMNEAAPLGRELVFHVGQFPYTPPPRPPWPPTPAATLPLTDLALPPLERGTIWLAAGGTDNQSSGRVRLEGASATFTADADGWNEFLHTDAKKLILRPNTTYRLEYDYHILEGAWGPDETYFYQLVRATGTIQEDVGWQRWNGVAGSSGRRVVTFTTRDMPDYFIIWGVRHKGAIRLENIKLQRVGEEARR